MSERQYPEDLCKLVILNMETIENTSEIVSAIEKLLFADMNALIKKKVENKKWEGDYDLVSGKDKETRFAPTNWKSNDDSDKAYYKLDWQPEGGIDAWGLSFAIGVMGTAMCLRFVVNIDCWNDLSPAKYKKALENFHSGNAKLQNAGFELAPNKKSLFRRFHFDAQIAKEEYPDFNTTLDPLKKAMEDLFKAHSAFDNFVMKQLKKIR